MQTASATSVCCVASGQSMHSPVVSSRCFFESAQTGGREMVVSRRQWKACALGERLAPACGQL
eukprot:6504242-Prymnesium_polylepis.1